MQVDFYLLAKTETVDKHRFACRIAQRARKDGMTVFMQTEDAATSDLLDNMLWTFAQDSFVPHTQILPGEKHDVDRYPVQIGLHSADSPCSDLLISLTKKAPEDCARFGRAAEIVLNDDADKTAARERFRCYRAQGFAPRTTRAAWKRAGMNSGSAKIISRRRARTRNRIA